MPQTRSATLLMQELEEAGVELWVHGSQLHYNAPRGALGDEQKLALRELKPEIVSLLQIRLDGPLELPEPDDIEAVWVPRGHQASMVDDSDVHNVSCQLAWQGSFSEAAAESAMNALLARHSILRTHYARDPLGRPLAVTRAQMPMPLSIVDLRHLPPHSREAAAMDASDSLLWRRFDLYRGPLVACAALRIADQATVFIVVAHHSLADALSQHLIRTELRALYDAAIRGVDPKLEPVPIQFRHSVRERFRWLHSEDAEPHLEYWRRTLAGSRSIFQLPYDRKTPPEPGFVRPEVTGALTGNVLASLRRIAASAQTTMSAMFSSLLAVVFARWSGRTDIAAWICHTGRNKPELFQVIGCFIDHWLLRVDLSGDPDFLEVLRRVHRCHVDAAPHLDITLHRLIPEVARLNAGEVHPGIVVNYLPFTVAAGARFDSSAEKPVRQPRPASGFSEGSPLGIIVDCAESAGEMQWTVQYSSYLFEEATIERFSKALAAVAERMARDPTACATNALLHEEIAARRADSQCND
jgi:hypothetical protein